MSLSNKDLNSSLLTRFIPSIFWIAAGLYFLLFSFQVKVPLTAEKFDPGPRLLPRILGGLLILGGLYLGYTQSRAGGEKSTNARTFDISILAVVVVAYILALPYFGFHLSTTVFCLVSMVLMKVKPVAAISSAAVIVVVVHLVFIKLFTIQLPVFGG